MKQDLPVGDDFTKTKAQVSKDLGPELHTADLLNAEDYSELRRALLTIIIKLIQRGKPKLMQIIYRVDISEASLGRELEMMNADDAARRLTDLFLDRERQKIFLRRHL